MATIYFGNRRLVVANYLSDERMDEADAIFGYETGSDVKAFVENFLEEEEDFTAYMYGNDYDAMMDEIEANFKLVNASGGLVSNPKGEYLFIFRRGKWDLPKGKAEKGETSEETALREVEEETNIKNLKLEELITSTYHIYPEKGSLILKQTDWYNMFSNNLQEGTPQTEEDIEIVKWIKSSDFNQIYENTFPSIIEVIENAI